MQRTIIKHRSGKTELDRRVCTFCGVYYPTLTALASHTAVCRVEDVECSSESDSDEETYNFGDGEVADVEPPESSAPVKHF